ncbi:2-amino-4-hydroxy-6-hydroxymethyldihydropteridine diphosphokinase [candidate division CSSED10-310 bacterium]|uniref:2-amino-4-hydroxy-6-hydroxymethyldihydropteridine diphosphokinase n=1 Tax=candidate division CSSED10-310 bacterium TaxID=2855610 RepID=A0ABV6Z2A7_UNCC1
MQSLNQDVLLSGGSNLGKPIAQCQQVIQYLQQQAAVRLVAISSLYLTEPVSPVEQGWFYNFALKLKTDLSPFDFLMLCQDIEKQFDRKRAEKWGPRSMDLDIIYYGSQIIESEDLVIPHQHLAERKFVLIPLAEIAPEFIDPQRNKSISKILRQTSDRHAVLLYEKKWFETQAVVSL